MGVFIRGHSMQVLICSSGMIDLVKIHLVHIGRVQIDGILLVYQSLHIAGLPTPPCFYGLYLYAVPVLIKQPRFAEHQALIFTGQPYIPWRAGNIQRLPCIHLPIFHFNAANFFVLDAIV